MPSRPLPTEESPFKLNAVAGRVVLITGGGSGIGFGIAKVLGTHGAKVVIMGRRKNFLDDAVAKLRSFGVDAAGVAGDVRSEESARAAVDFTVKKYGKLDTLVNSAAGNFLSLAEDLSVNGFKTVMDIDANGVFIMSSVAFEHLKASGAGVIINITATLQYGATWYQVHASTAKAAIDSITRHLALEWGTFNIRVCGIAPGPILDTPGMVKLSGGAENLEEAMGKAIPIERGGMTWEIGQAALFLCTKGAQFITGDTMVVDGGEWLMKPPMVPRSVVKQLSRKVESTSRALKAGEKSKL